MKHPIALIIENFIEEVSEEYEYSMGQPFGDDFIFAVWGAGAEVLPTMIRSCFIYEDGIYREGFYQGGEY